jgi:phosphonate transport system substrate-binding protein
VDDPEIWREAGVAPERDADSGRVFVNGTPDEGGYRILDARVAAMETIPTIFEDTKILAISDPIPNDTVSFGPSFPLSQAQEIIQALAAYASSEACIEPAEGVVTLCSDAFYSWTGAEPTNDAAYDPIRFMIEALGMTDEEILGE